MGEEKQPICPWRDLIEWLHEEHRKSTECYQATKMDRYLIGACAIEAVMEKVGEILERGQ